MAQTERRVFGAQLRRLFDRYVSLAGLHPIHESASTLVCARAKLRIHIAKFSSIFWNPLDVYRFVYCPSRLVAQPV